MAQFDISHRVPVPLHCNCIVCEIKRDIAWSKIAIFHTPWKTVATIFVLCSSQPIQMTRLQYCAKYCGETQQCE